MAMTVATRTAIQAQDINEAAEKVADFLTFSRLTNAETQRTYIKAIKKFFDFCRASNTSQPTADTVASYLAALDTAVNTRTNKPFKATTKQLYLAGLRVFFKWTECRGIYPNITAGFKTERTNTERKDYLTAEQVKTVISAAENARDRAILTLMFCAGLRTVEVERADVGDLEIMGDSALLYVQGKGHTDKDDVIHIDIKAAKVVQNYLAERGNLSDGAPLFQSRCNRNNGINSDRKGRMSSESISRLVKSYFRKCGLDSDRLTAHCTRHTAVTLALEAGATIQEVKEYARHRNIQTTLIYSHNLEKRKNRCSALVGSQIF